MERQQRHPLRTNSSEVPPRQSSPANRRPPSRERRTQNGPTIVPSAVGFGMGGAQPVEDEIQTAKLHVVCRLRPMSEHEKRSGTVPCVTASTERSEVVVVRPQPGSATRQVRSVFNFDNVLTSFSIQSDVFAVTLKPLIREVLAGFEAAAFAYGQTGTGKTYTMEGNLEDENEMGLVPRASAAILQAIALGNYTSSTVTASCLEIYNEELTDLLIPQGQQQQKLDLMETGHGVACLGLSEMPVSSPDDVQELISLAQDRRRIAETRINARSSRSHTIFTLRVCTRQRVQGGEVENVGKLHLVDLAGSECAKKASMHEVVRSGTFGGSSTLEAERERRNINQSLLTLGRVIAALRDESSRVPYRDSKLTRLLQEALGGCCRTVMIATISPAQGAVDETVSTLAYAEQAMGIQNRPVAASTLVVRAPSGEIPCGATTTAAAMEGEECQAYMMRVAYLTQEVEEVQAALARKIRETQELERHVAEREFIVQRTAVYADQKTDDARSLASALERSKGRSKALEDGLRRSSAMSASVRHQARTLHATATEHLNLLMAPGGAACTECVAGSLEVANSTWHKPVNQLRDVADAQYQLIEGLVHGIKDSGKQLHNVIATATVQANESAASENKENRDRLSAADAAVNGAMIQMDSLTAATAEHTSRFQAALKESVNALNILGTKNAKTITDVLLSSASDLKAASLTTESCHKDTVDHLNSSVCKAADSLSKDLHGLTVDTQRHADSLISFRSRTAKDSSDVAARRSSINETVQRLRDSHETAIEAMEQPLNRTFGALKDKLDACHEHVVASSASNVGQLGQVCQYLQEARGKGEADLASVLGQADKNLASTWSDMTRGFASLISSLQQKDELDAASPTALAQILVAAASSLDKAREETANEVAELRQQRQAEEKAVALLGRQKEELQADVARLQASLAEVSLEMDSARSNLETTETDQARCREEAIQTMMKGIESLLCGGMDSIGKSLKDRNDVVRAHLGQADTRCSASGTLAADAEARSTATGNEACQLMKSWAAGSDAACDRIDHAQAESMQASRGVHRAATEHIDELVAAVGGLQSSQDALQPKWASSRDAITSATVTWGDATKAAVGKLEEAASRSSDAQHEESRLNQEACGHLGEAKRHANERSQRDKHNAELLSALSKHHADFCHDEDATEARRLGVLSALGEGALAIADSAALRGPLAETIAAAGRQQISSSSGAAQSLAAALEKTKEGLVKLAPHVEACNDDVMQKVCRLQTCSADAQSTSCDMVNKAAAEVAASMKAAATALESQHMAFDVADAAAETRWVELGRVHTGLLKNSEAIANNVFAESAALRSKADLREELDRVDADHRKAAAELEDHRLHLSNALIEHQRLWHTGLAEKPMLAFSEEIFEDQLMHEVPSEASPLPLRIYEDINLARPTEQALAAEFHALHGKNSDFVPKEDVAPANIDTPAPRSAASKILGKNTLEETSGYPRMALRELQVGATPLA